MSGSFDLSADPDEHAQEQADEPDGQKHQVIAQAAGLDRAAPVAGRIHGLGRQVDQAVDGDHVEDPVSRLNNWVAAAEPLTRPSIKTWSISRQNRARARHGLTSTAQ